MKLSPPLLSPCHKATIYASRGDGVMIGFCSICHKDVIRLNNRTKEEEWLDGESPWTTKALRVVERITEHKSLAESFEELGEAINEFLVVFTKFSRLDRLLIWLSSLLDEIFRKGKEKWLK